LDETPLSGGKVDFLKESSEEDSGLLHQVKERLLISTRKLASLNASLFLKRTQM